MASCAARLISAGAGKSGKPCDRLTAPCSIAWRVISRITDSVKCATRPLRKDFCGVVASTINGQPSTVATHAAVVASNGLLGQNGDETRFDVCWSGRHATL